MLFGGVLARVVVELSPSNLISLISGFALLAYVVLLFRRLDRVARIYLVVSLGISVWIILFGTYDRELIVKAINSR